VPEAADPVEPSTNAIGRLLATDMLEDLLAIIREILEQESKPNITVGPISKRSACRW